MIIFSCYADIIRSLPYLGNADHLPASLLIADSGNYQTFYAPFEHINREARITICGITPGLQQARNALNTASNCLQKGMSYSEALAQAKQTASFSGPMRSNLVAMLNHLGLPAWLGIDDSMQLFDRHAHLVHYTSALRNPVFVNGANFSGTPAMLKQPALRQQIETSLVEEVKALPNNLFLPLGPKVAEVFQMLVRHGILDRAQVLDGMPHPSGANAERIAYFLGRKPREALSSKVNPDKLDQAQRDLRTKIAALAC
ncbi:hypothetical protein K1Y77_01895 [Halomonas qaidamensis]|uniref:Uracil-DNA glycosylase-like domain-containing protein n=1 Tax=Halomonas qaidamensis TaxID=2866211 RepID=A0ABY6JS20_9GAMM|nr:hypothetical protein [Halomonas qaidamensis]UYV19455.1 hypothetical protein K1Y77_01895 [Halomonas qaidamensis]